MSRACVCRFLTYTEWVDVESFHYDGKSVLKYLFLSFFHNADLPDQEQNSMHLEFTSLVRFSDSDEVGLKSD